MIEVYFLISLIVVTDGIILGCKYMYDKPNILDKELQPDLIIGSDYCDSLILPFIFIFPFGWIWGLVKERPDLYFLPFLIISILTIISLILLIRYRFKRYYLTDKGIIKLNLLTNAYSVIMQIDKIIGYSYRSGYRSPNYFLVATNQGKINFNTRQIKNLTLFKDYFKKHNIQYYEYNWLTGYDYEK